MDVVCILEQDKYKPGDPPPTGYLEWHEWAEVQRKAGLADADLHFHDARHEGITRLAAVLSVLELARAVGHRDLRMLQTYYNESAEDIAKKLK